ncbi:MAG: hypothetical protein CMP25_02725 [Rickettsiales bacterium]|nr:hypothetical protein [Rickettsiales bacterium]
MIFLTKKFSTFKKLIFFFFLLFYELTYANEDLVLHGGYTFETFQTQKSTSIYMSIFNNSDEDVILDSVSCDCAKKAEFHTRILKNDISVMKKLETIKVEARSELYLQPQGLHIMLFGLNKVFKDFDEFEIKFSSKNKFQYKTIIKVLNRNLKSNQLNTN